MILDETTLLFNHLNLKKNRYSQKIKPYYNFKELINEDKKTSSY